MTEFSLASVFPPASHADWRAIAGKALNGASFDVLKTPLYEGFARRAPLYRARRQTPALHGNRGWLIVQPFVDDSASGGRSCRRRECVLARFRRVSRPGNEARSATLPSGGRGFPKPGRGGRRCGAASGGERGCERRSWIGGLRSADGFRAFRRAARGPGGGAGRLCRRGFLSSRRMPRVRSIPGKRRGVERRGRLRHGRAGLHACGGRRLLARARRRRHAHGGSGALHRLLAHRFVRHLCHDCGLSRHAPSLGGGPCGGGGEPERGSLLLSKCRLASSAPTIRM